MPRSLRQDLLPMMATLSEVPKDETRYGFEFKWDGIRALCFLDAGTLRLVTRRGNDVSAQYPELRLLVEEFGSRSAVLDGEIVALDEQHRPDFGLLQQRMNLQNPADIERRRHDVPVHLFLFDALFVDGADLLRRAYEERREVLEGLRLNGAHWQTPPYWRGEGRATLEASRSLGLEGIVGKRLDSPYLPGARSTHWLKVKNRHRQEFVIGGWTRGEGSRSGHFGSLLIGYYRDSGKGSEFVYAGRVGSGFNEALLRDIEQRLNGLRAARSPFSAGDVEPAAQYVEPRIVIEVEFAEWTHLGTLRQASFKGLRTDKAPKDVHLEVPQAVSAVEGA